MEQAGIVMDMPNLVQGHCYGLNVHAPSQKPRAELLLFKSDGKGK